MKCTDARAVWNNPNGAIEGIKETFPEVYARLNEQAAAFVGGTTNPFNDLVHADTPDVTTPYYISHADDTDPIAESMHSVLGDAAANQILSEHFSAAYGVDMKFSNVCCSGSHVAPSTMAPAHIIAIQKAALTHN